MFRTITHCGEWCGHGLSAPGGADAEASPPAHGVFQGPSWESLYLQTLIKSFNKHLARITHVQGTVLETGDKSGNKMHEHPFPYGAHIVEEQRIIYKAKEVK